MPSKKTRKLIGLLLRTCIATLILVVIATQIDCRKVAVALQDVMLLPLFMAFLLFLLNRVLSALKWNILLLRGGVNAGVCELIKVMFVSMFLGTMIPSGMGVDIMRLVQLGKDKRTLATTAGSVVADRMLAVMTLALLSAIAGLLCWPFFDDKRILIFVVLAGLGLVALVMAFISDRMVHLLSKVPIGLIHLAMKLRVLPEARGSQLSREIADRLLEFQAPFSGLLRDSRAALGLCVLNLLVQLIRVAQVHFIFQAMGQDVPILTEIAFVPMIILLTLLPISPFMGLGIKEGAFLYFFGKVGVVQEVAVSASLLTHVVVLLGMLPGVILFFLSSSRRATEDTD
jgi:uncharacterized protein (TIRG00374 family)